MFSKKRPSIKPIILLIILGVILGGAMMPLAEAKAACSPHPTKSKIEVQYNTVGDTVEKIKVHFAYYDDGRNNKTTEPVGTTFNNTYNIIFTKNEASKKHDTAAVNPSSGWKFFDNTAICSNGGKSVEAKITQYDTTTGWTTYTECGLLEGDFVMEDTSVLNQLDPNSTYYALLMCTSPGYLWYTGSYTTINLSKYRHSVTFDYNDHGENFVLPTKNGSNVNKTAVTTNPDYNDSAVIDNAIQGKIDHWSTVVTNPTANGYVFKGWYTDSACTKEATFNEKITGSVTYYAKWIADGTVHYSNGIYNGFAPYWQVGTAPADGVLPSKNVMILPSAASFTNVGYKLAGWTTVKPVDSSATKEYDAGATLSAAQVNALYSKCVDGEITLYAVWERDLTQIAWNADMNKVYTSTEAYTYYSLNSKYCYNNVKGAQYALGAAIALIGADNQTVYVLRDADIFFENNNYSELDL